MSSGDGRRGNGMALLAHIRAIHLAVVIDALTMAWFRRRPAKDEVVDWLVFRNRKRLHSILGYKRPMAFEEIWRRQQQKLAA